MMNPRTAQLCTCTVTAVTLSLCLGATDATADVLMDQIPSDVFSAQFSVASVDGGLGSYRAADDLSLSADTSITSISGILLMANSVELTDAVFEIYPDDGGTPGSSPAETFAPTSFEVIPGELFGFDVVRFTVGDGVNPITTLSSGTHWITMYGTELGYIPTVNEGGPINGSQAFVSENGGSSWAPASSQLPGAVAVDLMYQVEGNVIPTPPAAIMLLVIPLSARRRCRSNLT